MAAKPKKKMKKHKVRKEMHEKLMKKYHEKMEQKAKKPKKKPKGKIEKVMREFKEGALHSGSKKGPMVKNKKQAIAIALSESRKAGAKIPKKKK